MKSTDQEVSLDIEGDQLLLLVEVPCLDEASLKRIDSSCEAAVHRYNSGRDESLTLVMMCPVVILGRTGFMAQ